MAAKKKSSKKRTTKKSATKKKTSTVKESPKKAEDITVGSPSKIKSSPKNKKGNKTKYFVVLVFVLLLAALVYLGRSWFFAAMVGGKPITRLELIRELEKQGGQEALDQLVTKKLIEEEAAKKGVNISDEVVEQELSNISDAVKAQGQTLEQALAAQGQSMDSLRENIRIQKTLEELLGEDINISDEEVQEFFDENKQYYGEDAKYEDIKDELKQQLKQQKISEEFQKWIEDLRNKTNIIYFVNYQQ